VAGSLSRVLNFPNPGPAENPRRRSHSRLFNFLASPDQQLPQTQPWHSKHIRHHESIHSTLNKRTIMVRRRRPPRPGALTELPPLKILTQILILQSIWYAVATGLILFTALVAGKHFSFDLVLSWRSLRGDTTVGWMLGLVWLLNSFIGYLPLSVLAKTYAKIWVAE